MSKTGQARVLTPDQFAHLLSVIQQHRYPDKNTALIQISYKLGLRVQEISLLQIKDVAELVPGSSGQHSFKMKEILVLPAALIRGNLALSVVVYRWNQFAPIFRQHPQTDLNNQLFSLYNQFPTRKKLQI